MRLHQVACLAVLLAGVAGVSRAAVVELDENLSIADFTYFSSPGFLQAIDALPNLPLSPLSAGDELILHVRFDAPLVVPAATFDTEIYSSFVSDAQSGDDNEANLVPIGVTPTLLPSVTQTICINCVGGLAIFLNRPIPTFSFTGFDEHDFIHAQSPTTIRAGFVGFTTTDLFVPPGGVPEPAAWAMMLLGLGALGMAARRRRLQAAPSLSAP